MEEGEVGGRGQILNATVQRTVARTCTWKCTCVYMYVYIYIYIYIHVHVLLYRYTHTCIHLRGVTNRQL